MNRLIRYFRANWESILIEAILLQFFIAGILDGNLILATIAAVGGLALLALIRPFNVAPVVVILVAAFVVATGAAFVSVLKVRSEPFVVPVALTATTRK